MHIFHKHAISCGFRGVPLGQGSIYPLWDLTPPHNPTPHNPAPGLPGCQIKGGGALHGRDILHLKQFSAFKKRKRRVLNRRLKRFKRVLNRPELVFDGF